MDSDIKHKSFFCDGYYDGPEIDDMHEIGICVKRISVLCSDDGDGDQFDEHEFFMGLINPMSLKELKAAWNKVVDRHGDSKTPNMVPCKNNYTKEAYYKHKGNIWVDLVASVKDQAQFKLPTVQVATKKRSVEETEPESEGSDSTGSTSTGSSPVSVKDRPSKRQKTEDETIVLAKLSTFTNGVNAPALKTALGMEKGRVNKVLYDLQKQGDVKKLGGWKFGEQKGKPVWALSMVEEPE